jgi:argininosuccinate synthase
MNDEHNAMTSCNGKARRRPLRRSARRPAACPDTVAGEKCVLAYSGGLDTTTIVIWLKEHGYEVHAVLVDVGQEEDLPALCSKALRLGAASAVIRDARPAMYEQVIPCVIGLGATYEGTYHLGTALARPFIAAEQVRLAKKLGGATLVHGATGKGNDQIRFEFAYRSLAPECPVLAPWKVWNLHGRSDMIEYLRQHGVHDDFAVTRTFSLDENLWHLSVEGGPLEDPAETLDVPWVLSQVAGRFAGGSKKVSAPRRAQVTFERGIPVALNGMVVTLPALVSTLNHEYRTAPWAWDLVIENRFTGIKSRGLYINPAAKLLLVAVDALARTCLNKSTYDQYVELGKQYGTMMYRGEFFSDQRVMLQAAAAAVMRHLTGEVTVQLDPVPYASTINAPGAIFSRSRATFEWSDFSHADAGGFIRLAWLTSIGRDFTEDVHGGTLEAGSVSASDVRRAESVSDGRLVPAAV